MKREQAIALAESHWWELVSYREAFEFQLNAELLCMPFDRYQQAAEAALGRPVFTHEFARPEKLRAELAGGKPAPTLDEIIALLPEGKRILILP